MAGLNRVEVIEPARAVIPDDEDGSEALLSLIPLQTGDSRKAKYLSWRATGFSVREACVLTPCTHGTLMRWRKEDAEFAKFETEFLRTLQKGISKDIIYMEFSRNMRLAMFQDFKVLYKAAYDLDSLSKNEREHLKMIRRLYTPADLVVLEKAVAPEDANKGNVTLNAIIIQVDGQTVEDESARRAAARQLLDAHLVKSRPNGDMVVDAEAVEVLE